MTSMPGCRFPGLSARATARGCPLPPAPPVSIAVTAWVPHSARATTSTFGNGPVPDFIVE
jgi:hypothetical protein